MNLLNEYLTTNIIRYLICQACNLTVVFFDHQFSMIHPYKSVQNTLRILLNSFLPSHQLKIYKYSG